MKEFVMVALLALFSDVIVPRLTESTARPPAPEAESEAAEPEETEAEAEEETDENELELLREENRALKELVGEKELALRQGE